MQSYTIGTFSSETHFYGLEFDRFWLIFSHSGLATRRTVDLKRCFRKGGTYTTNSLSSEPKLRTSNTSGHSGTTNQDFSSEIKLPFHQRKKKLQMNAWLQVLAAFKLCVFSDGQLIKALRNS
jgi:hypothetical protein